MAVDQKLLQGPQQGHQGQSPVQKHHTGNAHGNKFATPVFLLIMGFAALFLGISTSMFDIQASESMVLGGHVTSFAPNWELLSQIPQIISGKELPVDVAAAYYTGWIIELASLILVVCFDLALAAIIHAPGWVVNIFRWGIYVIAAIDVITNYAFMPGDIPWYIRIIVSIFIAISSFFFPIVGVYCLEMAAKNW